jgi:molybdopterin-guanine dinucleotide biosynthesis protein A
MKAAVILAGGQARRFEGVDKAWLKVDGRPVILRQLDCLRGHFDPIAMVVGAHDSTRNLNLVRLQDEVGGLGPLDGLVAGLRWSPSEWILLLACDMPWIRIELIQCLEEACAPGVDAVMAEADGRLQPLCAFYHKSALPELVRRLDARQLALYALAATDSPLRVERVAEATIRSVDPELASFRNLNRRKDLLTPGDSIE